MDVGRRTTPQGPGGGQQATGQAPDWGKKVGVNVTVDHFLDRFISGFTMGAVKG